MMCCCCEICRRVIICKAKSNALVACITVSVHISCLQCVSCNLPTSVQCCSSCWTSHHAAMGRCTSRLLYSPSQAWPRCCTMTDGHLQCGNAAGSQVCNLSWSKNVNEIVSTHGYSQNQIIVWKHPTMTKLATLTGHTLRVLYLAVSPDGQTIVTGAGESVYNAPLCLGIIVLNVVH